MRSGSFGLLEDKKRCRMVIDEMCVICDSRVGEDVAHFLVGCGEFEIDRPVLLDDVCLIVEGRKCLDEFWRVDEEDRWHCCWEKGWREYVTVMVEVDECVVYWNFREWTRKKGDIAVGKRSEGHMEQSDGGGGSVCNVLVG